MTQSVPPVLILYSGAGLVAMGAVGLVYGESLQLWRGRLLRKHRITRLLLVYFWLPGLKEGFIAQTLMGACLSLVLGIGAVCYAVLFEATIRSWQVGTTPMFSRAETVIFALGSFVLLAVAAWIARQKLKVRSESAYWIGASLIALGSVATTVVPQTTWLGVAQFAAVAGGLAFVASIKFRTSRV